MKVATYNVNGVNGRLDVLLRWLSEASPDIVVLQELKAPDARFPVKEIENAGYGAVWHGQKSWNGVAILACGRNPMLTRKGLPGDPEDEQSRYIEAVVDGIVIGGLYLPNGNPYPGPKFDYKLRWIKRLHDYAAELLDLEVPVVLAGGRAGRMLRQLHPDERIYTFWDYFRNAYGRDAGLRLDHFLLSPDLAGRLVKGEVDKHVRGWEHTSDHAPVWIELADEPIKKRRKS